MVGVKKPHNFKSGKLIMFSACIWVLDITYSVEFLCKSPDKTQHLIFLDNGMVKTGGMSVDTGVRWIDLHGCTPFYHLYGWDKLSDFFPSMKWRN